jgi:FkbM family methyltransferase
MTLVRSVVAKIARRFRRSVATPAPVWPVLVTATAAGASFQFRCRSDMEVMRAKSLATKEEGTIGWIHQYVRPGQVFCDIGANIGVYSLVAANAVGPEGTVYSFEPHVVNVGGLLANVVANGYADRVRVMSCALADGDGFFDFQYSSLDAGVAFNQLMMEGRPSATAAAVEYKTAFSLDSLIARGVVRPPHHVKIDVDGIEPRIVRGMRTLLTGPDRPLSVQVECDKDTTAEIHERMRETGYPTAVRHDTLSGKQAIAAGGNPADIAHNVIFFPK